MKSLYESPSRRPSFLAFPSTQPLSITALSAFLFPPPDQLTDELTDDGRGRTGRRNEWTEGLTDLLSHSFAPPSALTQSRPQKNEDCCLSKEVVAKYQIPQPQRIGGERKKVSAWSAALPCPQVLGTELKRDKLSIRSANIPFGRAEYFLDAIFSRATTNRAVCLFEYVGCGERSREERGKDGGTEGRGDGRGNPAICDHYELG